MERTRVNVAVGIFLVLGILALDRLSRNDLPGGGLVVSVLSNGGLQAVVEAAGGQVVRTPVGDKYILEGMQVSGAVLGGEKSGHVIILEHTTSGDGIVTALEVLRVMAARSASLAELAAEIRESRPHGDLFDLITELPPETDLGPWEQAGLTWAVTYFGREPTEAMVRAVIDEGPG